MNEKWLLVVCKQCGTPQYLEKDAAGFQCVGCQGGEATLIVQDNTPFHQLMVLRLSVDLPMALAHRCRELDRQRIPYKLQTLCQQWGVSMYTVMRNIKELTELGQELQQSAS